MDAEKIERLRSRGLTEVGAGGEECVRFSIQRVGPPKGASRGSLKAELASWLDGLRPRVGEVGGYVVPGTLSVAAQMVEALIPVDCIDDATRILAEAGLRLDLVEPRKLV